MDNGLKKVLVSSLLAFMCVLGLYGGICAKAVDISGNYILNENFNGIQLDSNWKLPAEMKIDLDGNTLTGIADLEDQNVSLKLPEAILSGVIEIDTRIKYGTDNYGMSFSVGDSNSNQGCYMDFFRDGRLLGTNREQNILLEITKNNTAINLQDDIWHSVKLIIDIDKGFINLFVDGELCQWNTAYAANNIQNIKFLFASPSATPFSVDYLKIRDVSCMVGEDFSSAPTSGLWSGIEDGISVDLNKGILAAVPKNANKKLVLTLPEAINSGTAFFETRIRYSGTVSMDLSVDDSIGKQRAYISFTSTDRLLGTNSNQTAMSDIMPRPAQINNGEWHKIILMIDMATKETRIMVDGEEYSWDAQYLGDDINKINFIFAKSDDSFDIDCFRLLNIQNDEIGIPHIDNLMLTNEGGQVRASYDFTDDNGCNEENSIFEWYRADTENGEYKLVNGEKTDCLSNKICENSYVKVVVTPVNSSGIVGTSVESQPICWEWDKKIWKEDSFDGTSLLGYWKNTDGLTVADGMLTATAKQTNKLWINSFAWEPQTTGTYIVEFKLRQRTGTEGFDVRIRDSKDGLGNVIGLLYQEQMYLTKNSVSGADVLYSYASGLKNDEWHTFKYLVNPESKEVAVMLDGEVIDWSAKYYADDLYRIEFAFKDDVVADIDDLKVYSITQTNLKISNHSIVQNDTGIAATAEVSNFTLENKKVLLIAAVYDKYGRMKSITTKEETLPDKTQSKILQTGTVLKDEEDTVRSFIWDSIDSMVPLETPVHSDFFCYTCAKKQNR